MKILVSANAQKDLQFATGLECIPLKPYGKLDAPVASHADMLFCILDRTVFCYEDYVRENSLEEVFVSLGYSLCYVKKPCAPEYPGDIALNVLIMGKTLFCKLDSVAEEIMKYANLNGYKTVDVKQGYAACSTLALDENKAITSDVGIYNALLREGKDALFVYSDDIELKGYNCGFIGGASGMFLKDAYFFGDLFEVKDFEIIADFIDKSGFNYKLTSLDKLNDFGGFKLIYKL